jgi:hypothetical protein
MQALPYFSHCLEGFASASKREEENKQKLAEVRKARDAAAQEVEKAREEVTTLKMKLEVTNNQLVQALTRAQENLDRERKVEAEAAGKIKQLSSQLELERAELARVRPLLLAEEKTSAGLRAKLVSAEAAAKAASDEFDYAVETIDKEVSGHMRAIVEVVAEQLSLQLDWNSFALAARARYEAILETSPAVPMTPGPESTPATPLPDLPADVLPPPPDLPVDAPTLSSELPDEEPPHPSGPPGDAPPPPSEAPDVAPPPPPVDSVGAHSAPLSAQVGEGSSDK